MKRFDVAIIGAGPAGSSAAISLARCGYAVALVDKQVFPREKLCGDFVSPINIPLFRALGVEQQLLSQEHGSVGAFRMTSALGDAVDVPLPSCHGQSLVGLGLSRAHLDHALLQKAQSEGASVFQGVTVQELKSTANGWHVRLNSPAAIDELSAAMLIGADGRNSRVAHRLGLSGKSAMHGRAIGFQIRLRCPDRLGGRIEIHLFPGGYAGLIGLGGEMLNLCLAIDKTRLPDRHPAQFLLQACLPQNPRLRAVLERSSVVGEVRSVYPVYFPPRRGYADRAVLVGDAARVNEPVTGEGIYFAMKSGMIAATVIDQALCRGDLSAVQLSSYARECGRAFRTRRGLNALIRWLIYRPALLSPLIRYSSRKRQLFAPFIHAVCMPDAS
jgi:geranylgeranyl reductase family protein